MNPEQAQIVAVEFIQFHYTERYQLRFLTMNAKYAIAHHISAGIDSNYNLIVGCHFNDKFSMYVVKNTTPSPNR